MKSLIMLLLTLSFSAFSAEVLTLKGSVTLDGKILKAGDKIADNGKLVTAENSYLKILFQDNTLVLGAGSEMELKSENGEVPTLVKGITRWISAKSKKMKSGATIKTSNAIFGVRGTNFLVTYNGLLGESEIICFDGSVEFSSGKASKVVKKNQWGGVGGRFGQSIGPILDLPANVISHFDGAIPVL